MESSKGEVIAFARFPHPDDQNLRLVCIKRPDDYVVWMCNIETNDYFWGNYFDIRSYKSDFSAKEAALAKFTNRLANSLSSYAKYL